MQNRISFILLVALLLVSTSALQAQDDTLAFWTFEYGDSIDPFFTTYIDEWSAAHDFQIERQEFPLGEYTGTILTSAFATGDAPDVFFISPGDWRRYAEGGLALPLEDCIPQYLKDDILPAAWDAVTLDGHIYSIPFEMGPVAMWYNKTILEEEGIAVPTTWKELMTAAEVLTTEDRYGVFVPPSPGVFENFIFYPFLWGSGGEIVNTDFTESLANSPETARALDLWATFVEQGWAPNSSGSGDPSDDRFPNGQIAIMMAGYYLWGNLLANYPDFIEHVGVAPIPAPEGHDPVTVYGGWTVMVNAATEHPDEACDFAVNMFGAEDPARAIAWNTQYNTKLSVRASVIDALPEFYENFPHNVFAYELYPIARPEPAYPPQIATAVYEAIQAALFGGMSGEEAAAMLADQVNAYIATR